MNSSGKQTTATAVAIGLRAFRERPLLGAAFLTTTMAQGLLQGLLVWALREVLLSFEKQGNEATTALVVSGVLIFGIWVARAGTAFAAEALAGKLAHGVEVTTMWKLLEKLLTLSARFYDKNSQGDLVMATYSDVQHIRMVTIAIGNVILHVTRLIGLAAVAWIMSPKLTLIGLVSVPLGAVPALWIGERIKEASRRGRGNVRRLYDSFLQVSTGIRIIKVNSGEQNVLASAQKIGNYLLEYLVSQVVSKSFARFLLEAVSGVGLIVVLVVGGRDVASGALSWQSLLSLLIAVMGVYAPTVGILQVYTGLQSSIPYLDRMEEIFRAVPEITDRPDARPLPATPRKIELRDVSFQYEDRKVIDSVSATFYHGETIGIVGPSGAGKSTLLSILLRLYDPTEGQVLLDGVDVRDVRLADYMSHSAIVLQEPFLFVDTIANNIRAARPSATMEEVIEAAKAAGIHDEIMEMEDGYETMVGKASDARGVSVGQKQRICIASALLKNAPLLFLDEATSNLDSVSERRLQVAIERLMEGRTTFVIAHRLSTLRAADRILVLDGGRMVGLGTHDELLDSCRTYHRLWSYQMDETPVELPAAVPLEAIR
ncbi:MAG TPA: ABC transporter ATP-binding protein [Gemmatimonadaceae bacterium]|nr:ABC transporter ATP-binding protein [Gemmatimonadaceae bacterium]